MVARFNILYRGSASEAADELDSEHPTEDIGDLRGALTNALRRIATLEQQVAELRAEVDGLRFREGTRHPKLR